MKFSSLLSFILTAVLMTSTLSLAHGRLASESENRKYQIEKIEEDLSREREKFLQFGKKEASILDQLTRLEKHIDEQTILLNELKEKIRDEKRSLEIHQTRLNESDAALKKVENRLSKRLVAFYKYAKRGYVQLLATSEDFDQLRKRIKFLKVIMGEDHRLFNDMVAIQRKHKSELKQLDEKIAAIKRMEQAEKAKLSSIKEDRDKKVLLLMKIHEEKEFYETAVKELELAAHNLKDTLRNLDKKQVKKPLPTGFEDLKGRLPLPFNGKILKSKEATGPSTHNNPKGIYILGPSGAEVKAIFPGEVVYSGWLKGYGQMIVINHGSRYFTISAHLSQRDREQGDMVEKGEVIGLLGETGSLEGPRLYFEIRQKDDNLDPFKWLKVH